MPIRSRSFLALLLASLAIATCAAAACSGGGSDGIVRDPGPDAVPTSEALVEQWRFGRAEMIAVARAENVLDPQWNVEPPPGDPIPKEAVIFQDTHMVVEEVLFGSGFGATLYLRTLGGSVDGRTVEVADQPSFEEGRRYLVFLQQAADSRVDGLNNADGVSAHMAVVGGAGGSWPLTDDASVVAARDRVCEIWEQVTSPGMLLCRELAPLLMELAGRADLIVVGTAGETSADRCAETPGEPPIVRDTSFHDLQVIRRVDRESLTLGGTAGEALTVATNGTICEGMAAHLEGEIAFEEGQRYLLFLRAPPPGGRSALLIEGWPPAAVWRVFDSLEPQEVVDWRGGGLLFEDVIARIRAWSE